MRGDGSATTAQARALRRRAPLTERFLWRLLRDRRLEGIKFRRQSALGPYVVDFVSFRHRLVLEADGPHHDPGRDAVRDAWFQAQGFKVLRFDNATVQNHYERVVFAVLEALNSPSPLAGEGGGEADG